jgi:alcohol dehydrogenase class IV
VIEIVAEAMPEKVRRIGELMGLEVRDSLSPSGLGTVVSDGIIAFNREVGLPTLKQLNIKESDLPSLAEGMMRDVCFIFLPVKLDQQEVLKVIRKAYAL